MSPSEEILDKHRRTARTILVDPEDRVLLLSSWLESRECIIWVAPGGALEEEESYEDAARRECREETGFEPVGALSRVWRRQHNWMWGTRDIQTLEYYYFARVDHFTPEAQQLEDYEEELFRGHKWWSIAELSDSDELIVPERLADLLEPLTRGRIPDSPIEVGR